MSAYTTVAKLVDRLGDELLIQLSNIQDPSAQQVNELKVGEVIAGVSARIDSYLGRYELPLVTVPLVLGDVATDMTVYSLHYGTVPDDVRQRYEDAVRWLERVASGAVDLGLPKAQQPVSNDLPGIGTRDKLFNSTSLRGF